ncbi:hypothetical protein ACTWPT_13490 [Nonomuraea sp. 3N208]|uniref:hypothetical protein n=1 Tax=Nonomuraea sp. 3N208 TaxID=3457421 RepID=UPI003FCC360D
MAKTVIAIRTEPHVAEVGDVELLFQPEVAGDEFLQAYADMQNASSNLMSGVAERGLEMELIKAERAAVRAFIAYPMLPESRELFESMQLPDRALVQLTQWLMSEEVYGAGRPTGSSGGSAPPSSTPGPCSTVNGRPGRRSGRLDAHAPPERRRGPA